MKIPTDVEVVPLAGLHLHPDHPGVDEDTAAAAVVAYVFDHAEIGPLLVQRSTGAVVANALSYEVAARQGHDHVRALLADLTDAEAAAIAGPTTTPTEAPS